ITLSPGTLPDGTYGATYGPTTFTATGGTGAGYIFTANALPGGLTLDPSGVLTGTPAAAGGFTFVVQVTDSGGSAVSQSYPPPVARATPMLAWGNPSDIPYGTALGATQLDATANVPGTFAYTPAAGTILGVGTQTLSATFTPFTTDYNGASASVPL